jgi:hypothetical protein
MSKPKFSGDVRFKAVKPAPATVSFRADQRSYVIVARTVQTHLAYEELVRKGDSAIVRKMSATPETCSVLQPDGRQIAQACHATARMMGHLTHRFYQYAAQAKRPWPELGPLTRIVLSTRDSFELEHTWALLKGAGIHVFEFEDTNEEAYGAGVAVRTAIATEPVTTDQVAGIIDYLPLWTPSV